MEFPTVSRHRQQTLETNFTNQQLLMLNVEQEFTPQHDSYELHPDDQLLANALHEPPYTSPKNYQKQSKGTDDQNISCSVDDQQSNRSGHSSEPHSDESSHLSEPCYAQNDYCDQNHHQGSKPQIVQLSDYKDEPILMDFKPRDKREPIFNQRPFKSHQQPSSNSAAPQGGSAKPIRNQNMLDNHKDTQKQHEKTTVDNIPTALEEIEDLLYLEAQKSAEDQPSFSGLMLNDQAMRLHRQGKSYGKRSEGITTARKRGKSRDRDHRLVSATCRYSSWERAYNELLDQEDVSIVDSLSRLIGQIGQSDNETDMLDDNFGKSSKGVSKLSSWIEKAQGQARQLEDLALKSCSTSAESVQIQTSSQSLAESLEQIQKQLSHNETEQNERAQAKIKSVLRQNNLGVDAKRYQGSLNLQRDVHVLLSTINELSDRNSQIISRQKKRLVAYERELYQMLLAIQKFQFQANNNSRPGQLASKLGKTSAFTGYNGMKLGDEVQAAPGMAFYQNQCSTSMISAYGSQGVLQRDTSQLLNLTPMQGGKNSTLTNSNFQTTQVVLNSNESSGEKAQQIENNMAAKKLSNNILINDQSDNSIIGQLRQNNMSRENLVNNAMLQCMTQRSHNQPISHATEDNEAQSHLNSQRKPQTARCGGSNYVSGYQPDRSIMYGGVKNAYDAKQRGFSNLLEMLHDRLRSLTERIHEVVTTKLKAQRDKSEHVVSSMKSYLQFAHEEAKSKRGRGQSESIPRSVRGSSKSKRMMRFKRYKKGKDDRNQKSVKDKKQRDKAIRRQRSLLRADMAGNCSSIGRQNSESCSPIESARINPFNRAFIKSTYRGGAANFQTQHDCASQQCSAENSQFYFTNTNTFFHFGGARPETASNNLALCKTQAMQTNLPGFMLQPDQNPIKQIFNEKTQSGFYTARNQLGMRNFMSKPSETVPVSNKISRLVSGNASQNMSLHNESAPHEMKPDSKNIGPSTKGDLFTISRQPPCSPQKTNNGWTNDSAPIFEPSTPTEQVGISKISYLPSMNNMNQALNLSRLSERRQEFSATFNNQLSSVKKDEGSSADSKSAQAIMPNFYPVQQLPTTSAFEVQNFYCDDTSDNIEQQKPRSKGMAHQKPKKTTKGSVTSRKMVYKNLANNKAKYDTEDAPKIPKLNLGKIKAGTKNEYFTNNISEYDDTSLGDYEMIMRNQRQAGNSSKDPSNLTASKSQNNQSIGSFNSRLQHKSKQLRAKESQLRMLQHQHRHGNKKSSNLGIKEKGKANCKQAYNPYQNQPMSSAAHRTTQINSGKTKGLSKGRQNKSYKNATTSSQNIILGDSAEYRLINSNRNNYLQMTGKEEQQSQNNMMIMLQHSDANSSTKMLFNNMTDYASSQANILESNYKGAVNAITIFGPTAVTGEHDGPDNNGDPYMSFIDSNKFSPIQSVSGEDIDDDDSLDQQKAKRLFFDHSALQDDHECNKSHETADHLLFKTDQISEKQSDNYSIRSQDENQNGQNQGEESFDQNSAYEYNRQQDYKRDDEQVAQSIEAFDNENQDHDANCFQPIVVNDCDSSIELLLHNFNFDNQCKESLTPKQMQAALQTLDGSMERQPSSGKHLKTKQTRKSGKRGSGGANDHSERNKEKLDECYNKAQKQRTPKSGKMTQRSKSSSHSPRKTKSLQKQRKMHADQGNSMNHLQEHFNQEKGSTSNKVMYQKHLIANQKLERNKEKRLRTKQQAMTQRDKPIRKGAQIITRQNPSPTTLKMKGLNTNSAAKFAQSDSNNFTLGATNINVFTLSPRAFSNSMLSSLSKEILSNLSSGQKKQPFVFSFQGSQQKFEQLQQPQQYLVDPQSQALHQIVSSNPIVKKNSALIQSMQSQSNVKTKKNSLKGQQPLGPSIAVAARKSRRNSVEQGEMVEQQIEQPIVIDQELPRNVSKSKINENILVLPLQIQKRLELQKHETQNSKKSLCLQDTFPEALITLNKEILAKRLSQGGEHMMMMNSASVSGLKSARESYRTLITTEEALKQPEQKDSRKNLQLQNDFKSQVISKSVGRKMPPKAPQTTRNILKVNNFMSEGQQNKETGKPIKFNFKINVTSNRDSEKTSTKTPKESATPASNEAEKEGIAKKKMVNLRHLNQLRSIAYGSQKKRKETQKVSDGYYPMSLLSPTMTTEINKKDEMVNHSAQTVLMPQSTTNQSSSKINFRKQNQLQIEFDTKRQTTQQRLVRGDILTTMSNNSSATPRNLKVMQKSALNLGKSSQMVASDVTQSSNQMCNLIDILSPQALDNASVKASKEKVVKQLMSKLAKSQSLSSAQQRRTVASASHQSSAKPGSQSVTAQKSQRKKSSVKPQREIALESHSTFDNKSSWRNSGSLTTKAAVSGHQAMNSQRQLKQSGIKRRKHQPINDTVKVNSAISDHASASLRSMPLQPPKVRPSGQVPTIASSSPLRSKILQRQSELKALARSCITFQQPDQE